MVSSWLSFNTSGLDDFVRTADALETVQSEIPQWIRKDIDSEVNTLMLRAGAKLQTMEIHGIKQRGLRASIVSGMKTEDYSDSSGDGSKITVSVPDPKEAPLPQLLDVGITSGGWKHPLFGRKKTWYWETGNVPWFSETMESAKPEMEERIQNILDQASDQIQGL
jgi:hypothetical protein